MPVATQAAIKGLTPQQVEVLLEAGGAHKFQGWNHNLLTDSGGFQLGALFSSPFTGEPTMLTVGPRVGDAMRRSIRWLDRCIAFHEKSGKSDIQNLFAIVQGGLDSVLRDECLNEMTKRHDQVAGYAIGGLSGGGGKRHVSTFDIFWRMIGQCTEKLPTDKPRYSMGIGFAEDLLVCVALGVDMADCVFPTRTARFGVALTFNGPLNLKLAKHAKDAKPIDSTCPCPACSDGVSRATLHHIATHETVAAHAITLHNLAFQAQVMGQARDSIMGGTFPNYLRRFFADYFGDAGYPEWCVNALQSVGVDLLEGNPHAKVVKGDGVKWEYSDAA
ncbi:queuine tRNA-ribosyltransferase [Russula earlei]|uniref:Queuine tRNA-ribosyltransferase n=1 Tax=Russula earlei TaxID=71964 RepID=A0ACC0U0B8_9AGAM|nr:queuine tRNA-ribosyltransferase [Russula earlei]